MNRKAVFVDVDGTLVDERGRVPDSARAAIRTARANGHLVFLCTGRSTAQLWDDILDIGFDGVIAAAGAHVEVGGDVIAHSTIPAPHLRHAVAFFDAQGITYILETNSGLRANADALERMRGLLVGDAPDADAAADLRSRLEGFVDRLTEDAGADATDVLKIFYLDSGVPIDDVRTALSAQFTVIPASTRSLGHSGEVSPVGIHKARGVELVLDHLDVAVHDTLAFGDSHNDLEMLQFVGTGVAMGNATPEARAVADDITGAPAEDGLRDGFRKYGLI